MKIVELNTDDPRQVNQFLELPFAIYRHTPQWVPPLALDARAALNRQRHPFFRHSEAAFFLAYSVENQVAGRLAILNNHHYNEFNHERTAFFYLFECTDSIQTARALFEAGFAWARQHGLERMVGPKGFTALDGLGMLIKGFEHRPALGIPYNLPYYPQLIENLGFTELNTMVSGFLDRNTVFPEKIHRAAEIIKRRRGLRVARFETRRDLRALVPQLKALYNNSLAGTSGNTPLTDEEAEAMANQILWFANPRLIKILYAGDDPVGFLFAYPDISAALQRTRGKVLPFGWIDLLAELRRTEWININGAGIIEKYRGLGGPALLFSEMQKSLLEEKSFKYADIVQIGLENEPMQRELSDLGIDFYKAHRTYQKML